MISEEVATSKPLYTVEDLRALVPCVDLLLAPERVVKVMNLPRAVDHREWVENNPNLGLYSHSGSWLSARFHLLSPEEQGVLALLKDSFMFSYGIDVLVYFLELRRREPQVFQDSMPLIATAWNRYEGGGEYSNIVMELVNSLSSHYPIQNENGVAILPDFKETGSIMGEVTWEDLMVKRVRFTSLLYNMRSLELSGYLNALGDTLREAGEKEIFGVIGNLALDCVLYRDEVRTLLEPGVEWDLPHLITFVSLVMEYNVEWAISVMEWRRVDVES